MDVGRQLKYGGAAIDFLMIAGTKKSQAAIQSKRLPQHDAAEQTRMRPMSAADHFSPAPRSSIPHPSLCFPQNKHSTAAGVTPALRQSLTSVMNLATHAGRKTATRDRSQLQYLPLHPQAPTSKPASLPKRHPAIKHGENFDSDGREGRNVIIQNYLQSRIHGVAHLHANLTLRESSPPRTRCTRFKMRLSPHSCR